MDRSLVAAWGLVLAAVLVMVLLAWGDITGHRLNGEPCGQPPAAERGYVDAEEECSVLGDRPAWCC